MSLHLCGVWVTKSESSLRIEVPVSPAFDIKPLYIFFLCEPSNKQGDYKGD